MTCDSQTIQAKFPSLFKGLGALTIGDPYMIKLTEDTIPYSLCTPIARNVAIQLREKVIIELNLMETNGIVSRVTEPLPWYEGDGCHTQKRGLSANMCRPKTVESKCTLGSKSHPKSG